MLVHLLGCQVALFSLAFFTFKQLPSESRQNRCRCPKNWIGKTAQRGVSPVVALSLIHHSPSLVPERACEDGRMAPPPALAFHAIHVIPCDVFGPGRVCLIAHVAIRLGAS